MRKYAFATQIENSLYEIFDIKHYDENHPYANDIIGRIDSAIISGYPIVSMKTTQFGKKSFPGGVWDGSNFINDKYEQETDYLQENYRGIYSFLNNNIVFLSMTVPSNTTYFDLWDAAFDNNVIIIPIPENENVSIGYRWNGEQFIEMV